MDLLFYQKGFPEENRKVKTEEYTMCVGGNACNAAITYSLLGGRSCLITTIGESVLGRCIREELETNYGIEVIDLLEDGTILPFLSAIWINSQTESRTLWGGHQPPSPLKALDMEKVLNEAEFFLTDDQFPQIVIPLFESAAKRQIATVFDAERWGAKTEEILRVSSQVIASADCRSPDGRNLFDIMRERGVSDMAVTDGEKPVSWEKPTDSGQITPMQVRAVDTLGAGDILHGAYCYFRFHEKMAFEKALEMGCRVSSISVTYRGPRQGVIEYAAGNMDEGGMKK